MVTAPDMATGMDMDMGIAKTKKGVLNASPLLYLCYLNLISVIPDNALKNLLTSLNSQHTENVYRHMVL